ncbi:B12 binding protein [Mumia flava]|uniref:B12 binding protein n=1 Tax=Mumia flava TaxID=1348852 RepID=A0A0B2BKT7_9ACTN|nr:MerR family transcriptional regulator [Mumia flava]PJJ56820.1 B12 binding protein [Mumia flava]
MYTIKHAAALVGVPEATLRAWERRYGVVSPRRSSGGYRLYSPEDVAALRHMHALVGAGWSARQAADAVASIASPARAAQDGDRAAPTVGDVVPSLAVPGSDALVEGGAARPPGEQPEGGELVDAARFLDAAAASQVLDWHFARGSFEHVLDGWLLPELERVGLAWEVGAVTVAGEHLVAGVVHRRLSAAFDAAGAEPPPSTERPRVLTGLAPGVRHELGMLAFATAARRRGFDVVHLGSDLPVGEWQAAARHHGARAAVLAVPSQDDVEPTREAARALRAADVPVVAVGGRHQDLLGEDALQLGHRIGPALDRLSAAVRDPRR